MYTSIKRIIKKESVVLFAIAVSALMCSILCRVGIELFWHSSNDLREEVKIYETLIDGSSEYNEFKEEIKEKQTQLEQKHTELTQGLADPHNLAGLLQMIFDKAWEFDIRLDKTVPQQEVQGTDYIQHPVQLEMTTNYAAFGKFIASLEQIPQIVRVDRTGVVATENQKIHARVLLTCFLRLDGKEQL